MLLIGLRADMQRAIQLPQRAREKPKHRVPHYILMRITIRLGAERKAKADDLTEHRPY